MGTGAEGQTGIQYDRFAVTFIAVSQPVRQNHQSFAHFLGWVVVLPAFLPVYIRQRSNLHGKVQLFHLLFQTLHAGGVGIFQIKLDMGQSLEFLLEIFVNIIPVGPVLI